MLLLFWLGAGVGIIGRDGDRANLLYGVVLGVGVVGAVLVRLRSRGMAYILLFMAFFQALIGGLALWLGWGRPWSGPWELLMLNAFFVFLFSLSSWLFRVSQR